MAQLEHEKHQNSLQTPGSCRQTTLPCYNVENTLTFKLGTVYCILATILGLRAKHVTHAQYAHARKYAIFKRKRNRLYGDTRIP